MLTKFEANRIVQNVQNVKLYDKRRIKKKTFLTNVDAFLQDVSVPKTIV